MSWTLRLGISGRLKDFGLTFLRHGYVQTAHSAKGQTCDRLLAHVEGFRENLVNEKTFYDVISRAREGSDLYTGDREKLVAGIEELAGEKITAMEVVGADRSLGTGLRESPSHDVSAGLAMERWRQQLTSLGKRDNLRDFLRNLLVLLPINVATY